MLRRFTLGTEQVGYDFEVTVEALHTDLDETKTLRVCLNKRGKQTSKTKWQTNVKDFVFNHKLTLDGKFSYHIKNKSFGTKNTTIIVEGTNNQVLGKKHIDISKYIDYSIDTQTVKEVIVLEENQLPNLFVTIGIMYHRTSSPSAAGRTRAETTSDGPLFSAAGSGDPDITQHLRLQINDLAVQYSELQLQLSQSQQAEKEARREIEQLTTQLKQQGSGDTFETAKDMLFVDGMTKYSTHDGELLDSIIEDLHLNTDSNNAEEEVKAAASDKLRLKQLETEVDQVRSENGVLKIKLKSYEIQESRDSAIQPSRSRAGTSWN